METHKIVAGDQESLVWVDAGGVRLEANLGVPYAAQGIVVFAHGSGSSRHSQRNRNVARELRRAGFATLLVDLLSPEEEAIDRHSRQLRFDIDLLAERLAGATDWLVTQSALRSLRVGYFGASTGAGAALVAASQRSSTDQVFAVVSRGGRPDLAGDALPHVRAPTLLIVGGNDTAVMGLNEQAKARMRAPVDLTIVPGASHLFEEPGTLAQVSQLAADWFARHVPRVRSARVMAPQ